MDVTNESVVLKILRFEAIKSHGEIAVIPLSYKLNDAYLSID